MKIPTNKFTCAIVIISSLNSHVICTIKQNLYISKSIMETFRFEDRIKIRLSNNLSSLCIHAPGVVTVCHTLVKPLLINLKLGFNEVFFLVRRMRLKNRLIIYVIAVSREPKFKVLYRIFLIEIKY
jgi:hypothetical protein